VAQVAPGLRVLVTGADGFVGSHLCPALAAAGYAVRRAVRSLKPGETAPAIEVGAIGAETDWTRALEGVACVIHLAARTHVLEETARDPAGEFHKTNVAATRRIAEQARAAGVRRVVYLSSVKVNGESTPLARYTEQDPPQPEDGYGRSKWAAEQALMAAAAGSGTDAVVLRPPLVYGPGVKGNFRRLAALVARGIPLPFGSIRNRRSLIYVENLAHAIVASVAAPQAAGKTYLVSDDEDVSTPELVRALARALAVPARVFPFPVALLHAAGALTGRRDAIVRLTGSLAVDTAAIRRDLDWKPPYPLAHGLGRTAQWYHAATGA